MARALGWTDRAFKGSSRCCALSGNRFDGLDISLDAHPRNPEEIDEANRFRRLWTLFQQNEDLINVGAYEKGSNPDLDMPSH